MSKSKREFRMGFEPDLSDPESELRTECDRRGVLDVKAASAPGKEVGGVWVPSGTSEE